MPLKKGLWFIAVFVLTAGLGLCSCSQNNKDPDSGSTILKVKIKVKNNGLYNFQADDTIGEVQYKKYRGPVGSKVDALVRIDSLSTFTDRQVRVRLELLNQDATRTGFTPIDWVQDANQRSFSFYIPQVETVPTLLNFNLRVYEFADGSALPAPDDGADDDVTDDDTDDDTADDDTDDDTADDDTDDDADDDTDDDVSDDDAAEPEPDFEADADLVFTVNDGQPGLGD